MFSSNLPHNLENYLLLDRNFFQRNPTVIAPELLGKIIVRRLNNKILAGKIVEVEVYLGESDQAAHSYIGKTKRNEVLFGDAGYAYVHSIHKYYCMDVVCDKTNVASSILIRAVEPLIGIEEMKTNRNSDELYKLTSGPGKFCQAFGIDKSLNGADVCENDTSAISIYTDTNASKFEVLNSKRIGISKSTDLQLRYYIKDNKFISK